MSKRGRSQPGIPGGIYLALGLFVTAVSFWVNKKNDGNRFLLFIIIGIIFIIIGIVKIMGTKREQPHDRRTATPSPGAHAAHAGRAHQHEYAQSPGVRRASGHHAASHPIQKEATHPGCPACGMAVHPRANFCSACGKNLR